MSINCETGFTKIAFQGVLQVFTSCMLQQSTAGEDTHRWSNNMHSSTTFPEAWIPISQASAQESGLRDYIDTHFSDEVNPTSNLSMYGKQIKIQFYAPSMKVKCHVLYVRSLHNTLHSASIKLFLEGFSGARESMIWKIVGLKIIHWIFVNASRLCCNQLWYRSFVTEWFHQQMPQNLSPASSLGLCHLQFWLLARLITWPSFKNIHPPLCLHTSSNQMLEAAKGLETS